MNPSWSASRARSSELRGATAPEEPAATGERSRTESGTISSARRAPSEQPRPAQAPILLPAGEAAAAELQRQPRICRVEAGNAFGSGGVIDVGAVPSRVMHERHAECGGGLLRRHAERERDGVGLAAHTPSEPADTKRREHASHAVIFRRFANASKA